ncbi:hypothetical protein B0H17DRAFT_1136400 [Mycena rosella]|uniref:Uncharacterized protein n=1 Tax=Mycena rosella TaxID=1033263 RepID=A0AAD7DB94_MYCRO|nr:hypothetical protein B0H17DRAFT_1136400 [Mycena rosella]
MLFRVILLALLLTITLMQVFISVNACALNFVLGHHLLQAQLRLPWLVDGSQACERRDVMPCRLRTQVLGDVACWDRLLEVARSKTSAISFWARRTKVLQLARHPWSVNVPTFGILNESSTFRWSKHQVAVAVAFQHMRRKKIRVVAHLGTLPDTQALPANNRALAQRKRREREAAAKGTATAFASPSRAPAAARAPSDAPGPPAAGRGCGRGRGVGKENKGNYGEFNPVAAAQTMLQEAEPVCCPPHDAPTSSLKPGTISGGWTSNAP